MAFMVSFPALLPQFQSLWSLSNIEAGWVSGIYFLGYVIAVPILTGLTDRIPAKKIIILSMLLAFFSTLGYALTADGLWSAGFWRLLNGASFAGTYMPGLKVLSDIIPEQHRSRAVAVYSTSYSLGANLSFFLMGELESAYGWEIAFMLLSIGPLIGLVLILVSLPSRKTVVSTQTSHMFDFRPALRNQRALAYMIAYGIHNGESSVMRAWIVAYLVVAQAKLTSPPIFDWSPTIVATIANLLGLPAIILMNELAPKLGRRNVIMFTMALSATIGITIGMSLNASYGLIFALILFYGVAVTADSGSINGGLVERSDPAIRGQSMAMHALFAAAAAFVLPVLFGIVLDLAGGQQRQTAWTWAFGATAMFIAIGPITLFCLDREKT
jgi:MFS family permease